MVIGKEKSEGDRKSKVKIDTCGTLPTPVKLSWEVGLQDVEGMVMINDNGEELPALPSFFLVSWGGKKGC